MNSVPKICGSECGQSNAQEKNLKDISAMKYKARKLKHWTTHWVFRWDNDFIFLNSYKINFSLFDGYYYKI